MTNSYSVRQLTEDEVPQYIDVAEFEGGVWAALLDEEIVAVCFEEEMAQAIASNHLATKSEPMPLGPWFPLNMKGKKIGYCLGTVLPKADKFFGH